MQTLKELTAEMIICVGARRELILEQPPKMCSFLSFQEFVGDIAKAIVDCPNEDFVVECVGVLGSMTLPDLDFSQLMQRFNLIPWVQNILVPGNSLSKTHGTVRMCDTGIFSSFILFR
jgi:hypothetical protein